MSNKRVNAVSFRLGVSRNWNNVGFFDSIFYNTFFFEDFWFRSILKGIFYRLGIQFYGGALVKRREDSIFIIVHYANGKVLRPLPKTKKRRVKFRRKFVKKITKLYRVDTQLVILKSAFLIFGNNSKIFLFFRRLVKRSIFGDSNLLCLFIEKKIKQRFSAKMIFFKLLRFYDCSNLKANLKFLVRGIRLKYTGPQGRRVGRSVQFSVQKGYISYETSINNIDYGSKVVVTKFGCVNIEVWLNFYK